MRLDRRAFVAGAGLFAAETLCAQTGQRFHGLAAELASLEKANAGRLGVMVADTGSGELGGYRQDELFAMCSAFKMMLSAAVLTRVDQGKDRLARAVAVPKQPLVGHSPLTAEHAGGTMTVAGLCHAAMVESDNTAANLMLGLIGGPAGFTAYARSIGDQVTRLDRIEPQLNESKPGDARDTTSPRAMMASLRKLALGNGLSAASRNRLTGWMTENRTGLQRLRKDMPGGWGAADKTGSDGATTSNDIAIFWPLGRKPVVVTAFLTECAGTDAKRDAVLAEVGRLVRQCVA